MRVVVLFGGSSETGYTHALCKQALWCYKPKVFILSKMQVSVFDSAFSERAGDEFTSCIKQLLKYDLICFATPVHGYSFSGHMKVFLDRLYELRFINPQLLQQMQSRTICYLSVFSQSPGYAEDTIGMICQDLGLSLKAKLVMSSKFMDLQPEVTTQQITAFQQKCVRAVQQAPKIPPGSHLSFY